MHSLYLGKHILKIISLLCPIKTKATGIMFVERQLKYFNNMNNWIEYYNKKAAESDNFLDVSDMHMGNDVANEQFLQEEKLRLLQLLQPKETDTLVDLGCSAAVCLGLIKDHYHKKIGIDLSEGVLKIAKKRLPDCEFLQDDITAPQKIPSDIADHVLTYGVLQFLTDEQLVGYIETVYQTLKRGGKAVVIRTPNKDHYDGYQTYRSQRNNTRVPLANQKLQWNWVSPDYIKEICGNRFDLTVILPTTGVEYPLKGFFDFVLIKK